MGAPATALLTLVTLACSSPGAPANDGVDEAAIDARSTADGLRLSNPTGETIYYAVFERYWATHGLFIWAQCTDAPRCLSIPPGGSVRVPLAAIDGYTPGATEAQVYYWRLRPVGDARYEVVDLHTVVVPLDS